MQGQSRDSDWKVAGGRLNECTNWETRQGLGGAVQICISATYKARCKCSEMQARGCGIDLDVKEGGCDPSHHGVSVVSLGR